MWLSMKEMISLAKPGQFALGAFHAVNLEQVQGILEAAVEERSPVILALDETGVMYAGLGAFIAMVKELAQEIPVPVSVQLDHVHDLDLISLALQKGYSGVLADFRGKPIEESLDKINKIKEMCNSNQAMLEIEVFYPNFNQDEIIGFIGRLLTSSSPDSFCISLPMDERDHPNQQVFDFIKNIDSAADIPLSLAGAGRWPEENINQAIRLGVWKINVGTRINQAFTYGLKTYLDENPEKIHPRSYLGFARDYLKSEVQNCIKAFKSSKSAK